MRQEPIDLLMSGHPRELLATPGMVKNPRWGDEDQPEYVMGPAEMEPDRAWAHRMAITMLAQPLMVDEFRMGESEAEKRVRLGIRERVRSVWVDDVHRPPLFLLPADHPIREAMRSVLRS